MKILFFSDSHIKSSNPVNRKDDYVKSLICKFRQIEDIKKQYNVDITIFGGDFFDKPLPSLDLAGKFIYFLFKTWIVLGNHDFYSRAVETSKRSLLGYSDFISEQLEIIDEEKGIQIDSCDFRAMHFKKDIEKSSSFRKDFLDDHFKILIIHALVVEKPFIADYVLVDDFDTNANLVLCSHNHHGFPITKRKDEVMFICPGALGRKEFTKRIPQVAFIEIDEKDKKILNACYIPLKVETNCWLISNKKKEDKENVYLDYYLESIESFLIRNDIDLSHLIIEFAKRNNIEDKVVDEALKRIL